MSKNLREYLWFIEPLDEATSNFIASLISVTNLKKQVLCVDGKKRDLWLCSSFFIIALQKRQKKMGLDFNIFIQEENDLVSEWKIIG